MRHPAAWLSTRRDAFVHARRTSETAAAHVTDARVTIDPGKWDYIFGRVTGSHNGPRSSQNVSQFSRIGVIDDARWRASITRHLEAVVADESNIARTFTNEHGTFQVRDSLFAGPGGFLKIESTWEITDGGRRLTTVIPMGEGTRYR
jgi:filamentous hemagglutinin